MGGEDTKQKERLEMLGFRLANCKKEDLFLILNVLEFGDKLCPKASQNL